jgi:signal transduction histidine kinase
MNPRVAEALTECNPSCCPGQILLAHEQERKTISRELHDVVAQHLTAILLRLGALKRETAIHPGNLDHNITHTQQLVEHSVHLVHQFVRNLRPPMLDDLGLIPALHSFIKSFLEETGIRVSLAAFAGVERANDDTRTVLYRVVQEALTNVARHAKASQAQVKIQKLDDTIVLTIQDNGQGFLAECVWSNKKNSHLGLLGMRERLETVGGSFGIESTPGHGTTITAQIPLANSRKREDRKRPPETMLICYHVSCPTRLAKDPIKKPARTKP